MTDQEENNGLVFDESMFAGADDATVDSNGGGDYFTSGHYLARMDLVKSISSESGECIVFEMTVLHDYSDGQEPPQGIAFHLPGANVAQVLIKPEGKAREAQDKLKYFLSDLKKIVGAALAVSPNDVGQAEITRTLREGLMQGLVFEMKNTWKLTKKNKTPFTRVNYSQRVDPSDYCNVLSDSVVANQFGLGDLEKGKKVLRDLVESED